MSKFTKEAIINSFIKLLNEKFFDTITVKDIVDDCGINRNTFYYNFKDIYALVDEILQTEINNIAGQHMPYHSWTDGLMDTVAFALKNKRAVIHLYNSAKYPLLKKYLENAVYNIVNQFVCTQAQNTGVSEEDKCFITEFYTLALVGLVDKWISSGMKENFEEVIGKTGKLLDCNIRQAINIFTSK